MWQRNTLHQRVVEIQSLTRMNLGAFLSRVDFVHLKSRNRCGFVLCQEKCLARRPGMGPITRTYIIVRSDLEPAGWGQEPINRPNGNALPVPTQNEGLIIRICQSVTAADRSLSI